MSEPTWELLGGGGVVGGPIDYVGDWSAAVTYEPGKVVRYLGVDYLCVNTALGQIPGAAAGSSDIGVAFPATPLDGQRFILVDSLTAPTYAWEFRYCAGITDAYKWVFLGGTGAKSYVPANETCTSATAVDLATVGPSVIVPRAGIYRLRAGAHFSPSSGSVRTYINYKVGAAAAVVIDETGDTAPQGRPYHTMPPVDVVCAASDLVKLQYNVSGGTANVSIGSRSLELTPVRLA